jgi:hypothetical protein
MSVDETTHPCGACSEPVSEHQEFCTHCGARQPAVAEVQPDVAATPDDTHVAAAPPIDLEALESEAVALVGQSVAFRSVWRRGRQLRSEPDPEVPPLRGFVIGRCRVIEARGAWVLLEHSSGVRGWCPVTSLKPRAAAHADVSTEAVSPSPALATVEALERLHALHTAGGLTDDEFAQAKKNLLASRDA